MDTIKIVVYLIILLLTSVVFISIFGDKINDFTSGTTIYCEDRMPPPNKEFKCLTNSEFNDMKQITTLVEKSDIPCLNENKDKDIITKSCYLVTKQKKGIYYTNELKETLKLKNNGIVFIKDKIIFSFSGLAKLGSAQVQLTGCTTKDSIEKIIDAKLGTLSITKSDVNQDAVCLLRYMPESDGDYISKEFIFKFKS